MVGDPQGIAAAIRAATAPAPGQVRKPFSIQFRGPVALPQNTYLLKHSRIGAFPLFLVPVGPVGQPFFYDAVFG